jgi:hypothetical protein
MKNEPASDGLMACQTHEALVSEGYKLIEDAWDEFGRRTYVHDDDANRDYLKDTSKTWRDCSRVQDGSLILASCERSGIPVLTMK